MKRITILAGHYGSGKTNIAINYALKLAAENKETVIADLDIVNPYFRSKDAEKVLKDKGVRLISSPYANSNVDTPALPAQAYEIIHNKDIYSVIDVGGDDRGALALGRYSKDIKEENNYEMLFVINKHRFLTATPESTIEIMREIEDAASMKFTGIVNNSNLGEETTAETVEASIEYALEVARLTGLELKTTTVKAKLYKELKDKQLNLFPIEIYVKQNWSYKEED